MQPGEELPLLTDEVDHRVGGRQHVRQPVGEGVEGGVGVLVLPEAEGAQPSYAFRGVLVLRGQQETAGAHVRAPWWGAWAAGMWARRCLTRASRVCTPELEMRASQRTTGTPRSRSRAARTSSGS